MAGTILSLFVTALFVAHFALIVYLLMWVVPRYWSEDVRINIDPELRKPFK